VLALLPFAATPAIQFTDSCPAPAVQGLPTYNSSAPDAKTCPGHKRSFLSPWLSLNSCDEFAHPSALRIIHIQQ
jgi:hypothetical protein